VLDVKLTNASDVATSDINKIKNSRTVRSDYLKQKFKKEDVDYFLEGGKVFFNSVPTYLEENTYLNDIIVSVRLIGR
jgi:hypothetical protein